MEKSKLIAAILILLAIEGLLLAIYGFVKGANLLTIISVFLDSRYPVSTKEIYVVIGFTRMMIAICDLKWKNYGAGIIAFGVFLIIFSILGIVCCIFDNDITASNVYGIVIEFVVMFILSLIYLIYGIKQVKS